MKFGISWIPDDLRTMGSVVRRTEEIGVDVIGVPDSQSARYRECMVTLTHVLASSDRLRAAPLVTNPVTRHPAVMAAAVASASELSGGRVFMCIGAGDSGVLQLGLKPARLAHVEEYVRTLRDLMRAGTAVYQGHEFKVGCIDVARPVPVFIAGNGPRTLSLAGRIADGVLIGSGLDQQTVSQALGHVAAGAAEAGRKPADLEIWFMARGAIADTREAALDLARPSLAGAAAHIFRSSAEGKAVPPEFAAPLRELGRRIDPSFKSIPGRDNPNGQLIDELGLTDFLANRLGVVGDEAAAAATLRRLRDQGVQNVVLRPLVTDRFEFLDRYQRVIKELRSTDVAR
jgi:5,10-methylenetetrahydromethanopterin reductase